MDVDTSRSGIENENFSNSWKYHDRESKLGLLGARRECYLCAMQPPPLPWRAKLYAEQIFKPDGDRDGDVLSELEVEAQDELLVVVVERQPDLVLELDALLAGHPGDVTAEPVGLTKKKPALVYPSFGAIK